MTVCVCACFSDRPHFLLGSAPASDRRGPRRSRGRRRPARFGDCIRSSPRIAYFFLGVVVRKHWEAPWHCMSGRPAMALPALPPAAPPGHVPRVNGRKVGEILDARRPSPARPSQHWAPAPPSRGTKGCDRATLPASPRTAPRRQRRAQRPRRRTGASNRGIEPWRRVPIESAGCAGKSNADTRQRLAPRRRLRQSCTAAGAPARRRPPRGQRARGALHRQPGRRRDSRASVEHASSASSGFPPTTLETKVCRCLLNLTCYIPAEVFTGYTK